MATKLDKSIQRESHFEIPEGSTDAGKLLLVELHPKGLILRAKGNRKKDLKFLSFDKLFWLAQKEGTGAPQDEPVPDIDLKLTDAE